MPKYDPSLPGGRDNRRLRNLLIYPEFQLPLIGFNVAVTSLGLAVVWVTGQQTLGELVPTAGNAGIADGVYRTVLEHQHWVLHTRFAATAVFAILTSAFCSLYLSHKIAGPMIAMRKHFDNIRDGVEPIPPLHFRDRDFLMDIPPLINAAIESLVARLTERRRERA